MSRSLYVFGIILNLSSHIVSGIMLRFVSLLALVALSHSNPVSNVFEIDISPEEAQRYLNSPPFTQPELSGKTATLPLVRYDSPSFRAAEAGPTLGHYWKNGREIENTDDYVEEVYNAQQYHGQDGLGAFAYGYQGPDSSKVENRAASGDVAGSYTYRDGNNELIKVHYWADHEGFHQEDNLPKVVLEPVQEAEDVREARLAHEKAWQEAAALAAQNPDPQGAYSADKYDYHGAASAPQPAQAQYEPAPAQSQASAQYAAPQGAQFQREGKAFASAQSSFQGNQYQAASQGQFARQQQKEDEVEPTGPPRGFFYSFTYPVSIIQSKSAVQGGGVNPGYPVDHDTVAISRQG